MTLQTIGKYELLRLLGKGSMGEVYLARDPLLNREVALKLIQGAGAIDDEGKARFEREAQAMAALNHPHIVTIFDFGSARPGGMDPHGEAVGFLAMEYLEGADLSRLISGRERPRRYLLEALAQACEGLGCAHRRGIVHRDVKPANIRVADLGDRPLAKLIDFGVAAVDRSSLTETGIRMGTVGYMAPEYLDTGKATPGSDLFALGVILYEILSGGRPPFPGESTTAVLASVLRKDPEPIPVETLQGLPPGFLGVVERALRKDPALRYPSAEELAAAIRELLRQPDTVQAPQEVIRVGKGGHCLSLRVALRKALPGAVITILPGRYREPLRLEQDVTLQGEGDPADIRVEVIGGLQVEAARCVLRGLTLQGTEGPVALALASGHAHLEACTVEGMALGATASARMEGCTLRGGASGPAVRVGGHLSLKHCHLQHPGGVGVVVGSRGRLEAEDTQIQGCRGGSLELEPGASARLAGCSLTGSDYAGVLAHAGATASLEQCFLSGHAGAGVHARAEARVSLAGCRLHDGEGLGVSAVDGGQIDLTGCDLVGLGQPGALADRGGRVHLAQCCIREGASFGLAVHGEGRLRLEACTLEANALGPLDQGPGAADPEWMGEGAIAPVQEEALVGVP